MTGPIGKLHDRGPYQPWMLHRDTTRDGPWGIAGAGGWNCYGNDGAVFLPSREAAEAVIRSHGHEPGPEKRG